MHRPSTQVTYQGISPKPELCLGERETWKTQEQIQSIVSWRRWDQTASWKGQGGEKAGAGEKEQMRPDQESVLYVLWCQIPIMHGAEWGCDASVSLGRAPRSSGVPQDRTTATQPNRTEQQFKGILGNFSFSLGKITQQFANQGRIFLKVLLITQGGFVVK